MTSRDDPNWGWEFVAEDFVYARLTEDQAAAQQLHPGPARDAAFAQNTALRELLAEHSIYVTAPDRDPALERVSGIPAGTSTGRCYTCEPSSGAPCVTVAALARIWIHHPDFPEAYRTHGNRGNRDVVAAGTFRRLHWPHTISVSEGQP